MDDVPQEVKIRRTNEVGEVFRKNALLLNQHLVGSVQLVLVEGPSKRSSMDVVGRSDLNTRVVFKDECVPDTRDIDHVHRQAKAGDYVAVKISGASSQTLTGQALYITSLTDFYNQVQMQ